MLVGIFLPDALKARIDAAVAPWPGVLSLSDFGAAEFAAVVGRRWRSGDLGDAPAREALADFDGWVAQSARFVPALASDIAAATAYLRRLDLNLRAPDAIHIAVARRIDAPLLTFDRAMAAAARALGCPVVPA